MSFLEMSISSYSTSLITRSIGTLALALGVGVGVFSRECWVSVGVEGH